MATIKSIEEKAKAYDEAIERAKKIHNEHKAQPFDVMLKVFPELVEPEDERIRKWLIDTIKQVPNDSIEWETIDKSSVLAWIEKQGEHAKFRDSIQVGDKVTRNQDGVLVNLSQLKRVAKSDEKQGEQKPTENVEPIFNIGDTIAKKHNSDIHDFGSFTITDITGGKYWYNDRIICDISEQDEWEFYEPVRQKSAEWGEEDEKMIAALNEYVGHLDLIYEKKTIGSDDICARDFREKVQEWLKSLKERYTWKPSDEQMIALSDINITGVISYVGQEQELINLYNELKKLKG